MTQDEDRERVRRCLQREENAWRELIDRTYPAAAAGVGRYVSKKGIPLAPSEEEEILAGLYRRLWEKDARLLRTFRWEGALDAWIAAVARTETRGYLKRRRRDAQRNVPLSESEESPRPGPAAQSEQEDRDRHFRRAFDRLSSEDRILLQWLYFEGRTYRDIARRKKTSLAALARRIAKAKERFLSLLPKGLFCL